MTQRARGSIVALAMALAVGSWSLADDPAGKPKEAPIKRFMRAKLVHSQKALEGLVTDDYELVARSAAQLQAMSKAEEWAVIEGPIYAQHSAEFRRAAEQLEKVAKENKADAAALAYMSVTMSCLNCHEFVRGTRIARGNDAPLHHITSIPAPALSPAQFSPARKPLRP